MLDGKTILIVEDEAILALDIAYALEDMGAQVAGPCYRLGAALDFVSTARLDGAVLDVDLGGEAVFPLADALVRASVPFVFHTGRHNPTELSARYNVPVCAKPTSPEKVAFMLAGIISGQNSGAPVSR